MMIHTPDDDDDGDNAHHATQVLLKRSSGESLPPLDYGLCIWSTGNAARPLVQQLVAAVPEQVRDVPSHLIHGWMLIPICINHTGGCRPVVPIDPQRLLALSYLSVYLSFYPHTPPPNPNASLNTPAHYPLNRRWT